MPWRQSTCSLKPYSDQVTLDLHDYPRLSSTLPSIPLTEQARQRRLYAVED